MGRHGGGAFSGKEPSKVDRSAAYMTCDIAKSVVAVELADGCEVQIAYGIGHAYPVCVRVGTMNPSVSNDKISQTSEDVFDMRPAASIERLNLLRLIFRATAAYGHFGRPEFPWEASDRVVALQRAMRGGGVPRSTFLRVFRAEAQLSTGSLDPCPLAHVYVFSTDGGYGKCPS
jgi:S-adenosylmethionine synthetase